MTRPTQLQGSTHKIVTGCGSLYLTVNRNTDNKIIEVFASLGKCGSCSKAANEAMTRCISVGLQNGVPVSAYVKSLKGIRCDRPVLGQEHILSCPDALAKVLELENNLDQEH